MSLPPSPMNADAFFDSNILIYAFIKADERSDVADRMLRAGGVVNVQVLKEFVAVARRKFALPWDEIRNFLAVVRTLCGQARPLTPAIHGAAVAIAERHRLRIYDALIIAAAAEAGCRTLYSEDLSHGQTIEGVRVVDPFR